MTITCENNYGDLVTLPAERFVVRPSVYAIFEMNGSVLVCNTKSSGKLWFPGGGIDTGEIHEEALFRECREEVGITNIDIHGLIGEFQNYFYYEPEDLAMNAQLFFYRCTTRDHIDPAYIPQDPEATHFRWMSIKDIRAYDVTSLGESIMDMLSKL